VLDPAPLPALHEGALPFRRQLSKLIRLDILAPTAGSCGFLVQYRLVAGQPLDNLVSGDCPYGRVTGIEIPGIMEPLNGPLTLDSQRVR